MDIQPNVTDEEHQAALAEIEAIWRGREGTEQDERLNTPIAAVEAYEEKRWLLRP
jgi:HTH-type transcriptional regulator/antitoxin HigA